MRTKLSLACGVSLYLAILAPALSGCNSGSTTDLTVDEKKNFTGAPRPANANSEMQKSIEEFRKKHPTGSGAAPGPGGTPPGGAPGG